MSVAADPRRTYYGHWIHMPEVGVRILARTRAQAKYLIYKQVAEAGYRVRYIDIRANLAR